ncbi:MAG: DNA repair protein RecO [Salinivirgaceae bacterium]|nr:DNA repair protein RecO [Salinivirgaceae bacterium]MDD4746654.1 DNA repair protein RecO [Salinivirgaceae bacterium]
MEKVSTKAIILQVFDYSDSQLIVHAYTKEFGRMGFIASKQSKKSKFKVLFQPLFMVELSFYNNPKHEMQRIGNVQLWKPFVDIPFNHGKTFINLFISELLSKTLKENIANLELFYFCSQSIELFDHTPTNWLNFHLSFMAHLSKYLGFFPTFGFTVSHSNNPASKEQEKLLNNLTTRPLAHFAELTFNKPERQFLLNKMLEFYQHHLPIGELQSHLVLQQF